MASSWTVALTYQVLKKFAALITEIDATYSQHLAILVAGIKNDFQNICWQMKRFQGLFIWKRQKLLNK